MITVIGLGYVGLTTALGFSYKKYDVYGFDIDARIMSSLRRGKAPFPEPVLESVLKQNIHRKFFVADTLTQAIAQSKIIFYCVKTPPKAGGAVDVSYVLNAIGDTLGRLKKGDFKILVIKSTVPPSTSKEIIIPFIESRGFIVGRDIGLVNNPEFLRQGRAWDDFIRPDRIVIGQADRKSGALVKDLYSTFRAPVYTVSLNTAEFIKYLSNALLATLVSFSNEMAMMSEKIGDIDLKRSFRILHRDKRWSGTPANMSTYVYPGCGFGGSCLPKDTQALYSLSASKGYESLLLKNVMEINKKIKEHVVATVEKKVKKDEYIGILGLSFKPGVSDVRESPAGDIIRILRAKGYRKIIVYDPRANEEFKRRYRMPVRYGRCMDDVLKRAVHVLILTAWEEFKDKKKFDKKNVFDFRYIL